MKGSGLLGKLRCRVCREAKMLLNFFVFMLLLLLALLRGADLEDLFAD